MFNKSTCPEGLPYPKVWERDALPLHMQSFRIRTHDQQVTKAQLYRCTRARPPHKLIKYNP